MNNDTLVKLVTVLAAACLLPAPIALAVDPPPDGGYPNQNTAEGDGALFSLTTGSANTAIGNVALYANTTGSFNTAVGQQALVANVAGNNNTAVETFALGSNLG